MAGKYTIRSKEEKLAIVKRNLAGETSWSLERETGCSHRLIQEWTRKYLAEGEAGLEVKKKPGNPLSRYERRKELTYEEQRRIISFASVFAKCFIVLVSIVYISPFRISVFRVPLSVKRP